MRTADAAVLAFLSSLPSDATVAAAAANRDCSSCCSQSRLQLQLQPIATAAATAANRDCSCSSRCHRFIRGVGEIRRPISRNSSSNCYGQDRITDEILYSSQLALSINSSSRWTLTISSLPPLTSSLNNGRYVGTRRIFCPLNSTLPDCTLNNGFTSGNIW